MTQMCGGFFNTGGGPYGLTTQVTNILCDSTSEDKIDICAGEKIDVQLLYELGFWFGV